MGDAAHCIDIGYLCNGRNMTAKVEMIGKTFGRLTVLSEAGSDTQGPRWRCLCVCGRVTEVSGKKLRYGATKSCGCLQDEVRRKKVDVIGLRFGRLIITGDAEMYVSPSGKARLRQVSARCDCGNDTVVTLGSLKEGITTSCGCYWLERLADPRKHGHTRKNGVSPEYRSWRGAIQRCENPNAERFPNYGGRGVVMCREWRESFASFLNDMGQKPSATHSIDRIDVDGNYEPKNCRWATPAEQASNKRPRKKALR